MYMQSIELPHRTGSLPSDVTPEQRIVAGLAFHSRPGKARADIQACAIVRLARRVGTEARCAVARPENRAQLRQACNLQEANGAVGVLLEKMAVGRTRPQDLRPLHDSLRRLARAVASSERSEAPGLVLRAISRAHASRLDIDALFALRTGLLKADQNDREWCLAGVREPAVRSWARQALHVVRQSVLDACARKAVEVPIAALLQLAAYRGSVSKPHLLQVEAQLFRLRERMHLLLDTRPALRVDLVDRDVQHRLRVGFLEPAVSGIKSSELLRLHDMMDKHAAASSPYDLRSLLPELPLPVPQPDAGDEFDDRFSNDSEPGLPPAPMPHRGADLCDTTSDRPYDMPGDDMRHEVAPADNDYQAMQYEAPLAPSASSMRLRMAASIQGTLTAGYVRSPPELDALAETAHALMAAVRAQLQLRRYAV